jgi:hypothetical protein
MATTDTTLTTRLSRGAALTIAAGALALAATGCSVTIGPGVAPSPSPSADGYDDGPSAGPTPTPTSTPTPTPTPGGKHGGATPTKAPKPSGPQIVYFRVKQKPQCPQGTNVNPIPGVPVIVEWRVERAHQVTLSVDGPGAYGTYGAEGSETVSLPCSGEPGTKVTHTYQLTTVGGGPATTKTISASATVHEIAQV